MCSLRRYVLRIGQHMIEQNGESDIIPELRSESLIDNGIVDSHRRVAAEIMRSVGVIPIGICEVK